MKSFMKGCAITAFIFAVLGCVLGMIGSTMAGRTTISQVVEAATGGRVRLNPEKWWSWSMNMGGDILDEIDDIDFIGDFDIGEAGMFDANKDIYFEGDVEKYCPGTDIQDLEIEVGGCSLETKVSGDDRIYLEMKNAHKFQGYVEDGTLYIRATTGSVNHWSEMGSRVITLYLPENYSFHEVKADLGAGEMRFDGLKAEEVSLESGAGRIASNRLQAKSLEISIGAGFIELKDMEADTLEVEVGMGEFVAEGAIHGSASVECSMGNVEMTLEGSEKDFNYELEGSMGNIELGAESFSGFSREKKIENNARKNMEIECSMGNIFIRFKE